MCLIAVVSYNILNMCRTTRCKITCKMADFVMSNRSMTGGKFVMTDLPMFFNAF